MKAVLKKDLEKSNVYRCRLSGKLVIVTKVSHDGYPPDSREYDVDFKYFNDLTGVYVYAKATDNQLMEE